MTEKEYQERVRNGYIIVGMIVLFIVGLFSKRADFIFTLVISAWVVWIFAKEFLASATKKLAKRKEHIHEVVTPEPVAVMAGVEDAPATTMPLSNDIRKNTITATRALPKHIEFIKPESNSIPALYDGKRWHNITLGKDGHWGIFGTTGSGKGNVLQLIALSALSLGPNKAHLTILDGKGGLDYAFALDIDHAYLFYGNNLDKGAQYIVNEMERRNKILMDARKRNIIEYNRANPASPIPLQIVIADELLAFSDNAKDNLSLFAAQCRAMGGILIVATQYPTTDVIPSQVQANVTNRLVGRLVSSEHSRVALRRIKADNSMFEPAMIPKEYPGIMVLRQDSGNEVLGRAPELTETVVSEWINDLASHYPRVNPMPEIVTQGATGVSEAGVTTAQLTDEEIQKINDWEDEKVSRREMARRLYKMRGGTGNYDGSGPIFQIIKRYLDTTV